MKTDLAKIITRSLALISCLVTLGCDAQLSKDYAYQRVDQEYPWGRLSVVLLGKDSNVDGSHPVRSTPYDLRVLVTVNAESMSQPNSNCRVALESLMLMNTDTRGVAFAVSKLERGFETGYKTTQVARFQFDRLNLSYDDYSIRIEFSVIGGCVSDKKMIEVLRISRAYKEEEITFWDKLMGI